MNKFKLGEVCIYAVAVAPNYQKYIGSEVTIEEVGPIKAFNPDGSEAIADYMVSGLPAPTWGGDPAGWLGVKWFQLRKKNTGQAPEAMTRTTEEEVEV
jgi:hypothetical protein